MSAIAAGRMLERRGRSPAVGIWLVVLAGLVALMVLVGGYTRLTDSGLSITEWRPVTGAIPPLGHDAWQAEMEKYRQIPEYQLINKGMSLEAFQRIYLIEYSHRLLGRLIGVVFALPFLIFWWRGMIDRELVPRLLALFALGGLQGFIGWWMVASGLVDRTDVSQYRLTIHLGMAVLIFGLLVATAADVLQRRRGGAAQRALRGPVRLLLAIVFLQVLLGGLVAGLDAGLAHNTWPLMDGAWVPDGLLVMEPWWLNPFENAMTVQFNHRVAAYAVAAVALFVLWRSRRADARSRSLAGWLAAAVALQIGLGIWTLLSAVPMHLGLAHQGGALVVMALAVLLLRATGEETL